MIKLERPETERGYWELIDSIGGLIWGVNHDASHGRIELTIEDKKGLMEMQELNNQLVDELFELFGVIHPKNCPIRKYDEKMIEAPPGMTWYWDWHTKMKTECYTAQYEGIICSACALSGGVDKYVNGQTIPCTLWNGALYKLIQPHRCAILDSTHYGWSKTQLLDEIEKIGGEEAVILFLGKELLLLNPF